MIKRVLAAFALLSMVSGGAMAQMAFVAGTDYQEISPVVKTGQPDKVLRADVGGENGGPDDEPAKVAARQEVIFRRVLAF